MPPTTRSALMLEAKLALFSLLFAFGSFLGAFCAFGRVFGRSEPVFSCHGSILEGFRPRFGRVFGIFFWRKITENLKNTFLASIFEGFGPRFGRVFGRFVGPKIHAKCEDAFHVQHQQNTAWAHEFWGSALATSNKNRAKIHEKSHVFWDIDFVLVFTIQNSCRTIFCASLLACIFEQKSLPKTLPKRGPNPSKIDAKNGLFF